MALLISQPFMSLLPSQSAKLALHGPSHTPGWLQCAVRFAVEHTTLQPPQFFTSVNRLISQPSASLSLLQSS